MRIKVWDVPTRALHWLLVLAFISAYYTSLTEWFLDYHTISGYLALGFVSLRIFWGFAGNRYARFSNFIATPGEAGSFLLRMIRREPVRYLGHNPVVGWAVIFMLLAILAITVAGIITYGGEEGRGIAAGYVSFDTAQYTKIFHVLLAYFMLLVIAGHISAALYHDFVLKENIIVAMITGDKDEGEWAASHSRADLLPGRGSKPARSIFWTLLAILALFALTLLSSGGSKDFEGPVIFDKAGERVYESELWSAECGESCHGAFHPTLLAAESWRAVAAGLDDHFGDDASLDDEDVAEILDYMLASSAEHSTSEASIKLLRSMEAGVEYIRVTDLPYWKKKHSDISSLVYNRSSITSKSNCGACHSGADKGSFEDADIKIPE